MMPPFRRMLALLAAGLLGGWAGAGCQSNKSSGSSAFAAVEFTNQTVTEIRTRTVAVFLQNGYQVALALGENMVFEKEGSFMRQVVYGDWIPDQNVWVRVPAIIVPVGADRHRLECKAFMVRHKGDRLLEEEVRMSQMRRKPFQEMLDQVARQIP